MAHDISIDAKGRAEMMYVGAMPWHGLGTPLKEPPTAEKAILAAHLDWRVVKKQLYVGDEHRPLPGQFAIVRADRWDHGEDSIFEIVGQSYTPLQNTEAFEFFDPIVKMGAASYESAGALKNGERVWVMARLAKVFEVTRGDNIAPYLLLSNTHNGTGSVQVKFTPVRVVCRNTLNEALGRGPAIRVAHTQDMRIRLEDTADVVLAEIERHFDELRNRFKAMLAIPMAEPSLNSYLSAVFPDPTARIKDQKRHGRAMAQSRRDRFETTRLFYEGQGNDLPGVKGTLWAAYNGVTEYMDFHGSRFGDTKWLENIWFGDASVVKARALDEALRLVRPN